MGYRFYEDGECIVCKIHTDQYCDSCGRYICDKHRIAHSIKKSATKIIQCRNCYEKGKPIKNRDNHGFHPEFPI